MSSRNSSSPTLSQARGASDTTDEDQRLNGDFVPPHLQYQNSGSWHSGSSIVPPVPELTEDEGSELTEYSDYSVNVQHPFSSESNPLGIDRNRDIANATAIARLSAGDGILHTLPVAGENATSSFVADEHVGLYKPRYIAGIPKVCQRIRSKVPEKAVSFSFDFLCNFFSGITWSPGLMFIPPHRTSILPNHAYWVVDPATDPHLPSAPCEHGAKLVPFLKAMPEDNPAWDFPEDFPSTSEDVPLFVKHRLLNVKGELQWRYIYYGHYSQTRWSDKLDHDTMKKCVPASVKEKWAQDLSVRGRGKEMDRTLRAHFFPSPEYEGPLPGHATRDGGSIDTDRFSEREDQVLPALRRHAARLRSWKLDADMRTRMITKDFILESFERSEADIPKGLRLWWEYLECVDYREDFYHMCKVIQARTKSYL